MTETLNRSPWRPSILRWFAARIRPCWSTGQSAGTRASSAGGSPTHSSVTTTLTSLRSLPSGMLRALGQTRDCTQSWREGP